MLRVAFINLIEDERIAAIALADEKPGHAALSHG
jgi:hypothetical protein